jgi:molybdopterin synthase sulfur carrier subunit
VNRTVTILFFGQLTDITGSSATEILLQGNDTDALREELINRFPMLKQSTFVMTVDRKIIRQNTPIGEGSEIALLPPFSGG